MSCFHLIVGNVVLAMRFVGPDVDAEEDVEDLNADRARNWAHSPRGAPCSKGVRLRSRWRPSQEEASPCTKCRSIFNIV